MGRFNFLGCNNAALGQLDFIGKVTKGIGVVLRMVSQIKNGRMRK